VSRPDPGGRGVSLAPLRDEDSDSLFEWINDRDLVVLNAPYAPVTRADHDRWFADVRNRDDVRIFGIRLGEDGRLIGTCQLLEIDRARGTCELQIRIGDRTEWGLGHGTEAVRLLLEHAFGDLGLKRVELDVFAHNERAIRAYEKAGFDRVAVRADPAIIEGAPVQVVVMACDRGSARD
jgi:RimJ/RimL family protein N-acetyltransferase